ncbi:unnamed protein product [marine sediment metagenome]|uniref:Uncharacterized protein n=1 Tax=marine sediment metagenome TaxID=412755 RepID=X0SYJ7_9ZZZZ
MDCTMKTAVFDVIYSDTVPECDCGGLVKSYKLHNHAIYACACDGCGESISGNSPQEAIDNFSTFCNKHLHKDVDPTCKGCVTKCNAPVGKFLLPPLFGRWGCYVSAEE